MNKAPSFFFIIERKKSPSFLQTEFISERFRSGWVSQGQLTNSSPPPGQSQRLHQVINIPRHLCVTLMSLWIRWSCKCREMTSYSLDELPLASWWRRTGLLWEGASWYKRLMMTVWWWSSAQKVRWHSPLARRPLSSLPHHLSETVTPYFLNPCVWEPSQYLNILCEVFALLLSIG